MDRPTVADFNILDPPEVCHKELGELRSYTFEELRFFAEQLRLPNWEKYDRKDILENMGDHVVAVLHLDPDSYILEKEYPKIENPQVIIFRVLEEEDDSTSLYYIYNGRSIKEIYLEKGRILNASYYFYPEGHIHLYFNEKNELTNRSVRTTYGSISEDWNNGKVNYEYNVSMSSGNIKSYKEVTKEEYMKNIDDFTLQLMRDTGMLKDVSNIVSGYLYP